MRGCAHHHAFEHHAHLAVFDLFQDLTDHRFEIDRHKAHLVRAAEAVPQIVGNLLDANFVRRATQIKEAIMYATATAHQHIAGNTRVKTAGNQ
ncbi:hypothetical protein D3C75_1236480 [compost metagenome]